MRKKFKDNAKFFCKLHQYLLLKEGNCTFKVCDHTRFSQWNYWLPVFCIEKGHRRHLWMIYFPGWARSQIKQKESTRQQRNSMAIFWIEWKTDIIIWRMSHHPISANLHAKHIPRSWTGLEWSLSLNKPRYYPFHSNSLKQRVSPQFSHKTSRIEHYWLALYEKWICDQNIWAKFLIRSLRESKIPVLFKTLHKANILCYLSDYPQILIFLGIMKFAIQLAHIKIATWQSNLELTGWIAMQPSFSYGVFHDSF